MNNFLFATQGYWVQTCMYKAPAWWRWGPQKLLSVKSLYFWKKWGELVANRRKLLRESPFHSGLPQGPEQHRGGEALDSCSGLWMRTASCLISNCAYDSVRPLGFWDCRALGPKLNGVRLLCFSGFTFPPMICLLPGSSHFFFSFPHLKKMCLDIHNTYSGI